MKAAEKTKTMSETYGLPADYQPNDIATTMDAVSGETYWNSRRIGLSRLYQFAVYALARDLAKSRNAKVLVDVGCGTGMKLPMIHAALPDLEITGIDQQMAVEFCRAQHPFARFAVDDFDHPNPDLPLPKADIVICADVIEHVINPDVLLNYLRSRLEQGGVIVLSTPDRGKMAGEAVRKPLNRDHIREWTADEFRTYLESRGFTVLQQTHQFGLKPALNTQYAKVLLRHFLQGRPKHLRMNQVAVIQPISE